jgi:hypothetical protein
VIERALKHYAIKLNLLSKSETLPMKNTVVQNDLTAIAKFARQLASQLDRPEILAMTVKN